MQMSTFPLWDLSLVVEALTRAPFEPLAQVSFKLLSLKTAFLLAITLARRVGDLQALSIKEPFFLLFEDRVLRQDPLYLPKVALCVHRSQETVLSSFYVNPQNEKERSFQLLDVRQCLLHYLDSEGI